MASTLIRSYIPKELHKKIEKGAYEEAREMLATLKEKYGGDSNPELVKEEAMLSFMED